MGFRVDDPLVASHYPLLPIYNSSFRVRPSPGIRPELRGVVQRALGLDVKGYCLPIPDLGSIVNKEAAVIKRLDPLITLNRKELRRFRHFVRVWVRKNLIPFAATKKFSFYKWLNKTTYSLKRKQELIEVYESLPDFLTAKDLSKIKSFVKKESYDTWKFPRSINARCDAAKVIFGPYIKALEKVMYRRPEFIKHVPVADRPKYLLNRLFLAGNKYYTTDYSAYDGRQILALMKACEFQLYSHMFKNFPHIVSLLHDVLGGLPDATHPSGKQTLHMGSIDVIINSCRMSGEMSTSLGNGFLNLMSIYYAFHKHNIPVHGVCVEGDDGIVSAPSFPPQQIFRNLNLDLKVEEHSQIGDAQFCHLVFAPDLQPLVDPRRYLIKFGWSDSNRLHAGPNVMKGLLRAKAFSYLYMAPCTPVLRELCIKALEYTSDVQPIYEDTYMEYMTKMQKTKSLTGFIDTKVWQLATAPLTIEQYATIYRCYGCAEEELKRAQIAILNMPDLGTLTHPDILRIADRFCHPLSGESNEAPLEYYKYYVQDVPPGYFIIRSICAGTHYQAVPGHLI